MKGIKYFKEEKETKKVRKRVEGTKGEFRENERD